jgi:protein SCO1/2
MRALRRLLIVAALAAGFLLPAPAAALTPQDEARALRASQAAIGRTLGDYAFRDARGEPVRLAQLRGKPVVISLVYTGCFSACPVATQFLAKAVAEARAALGPESFEVVTIGFNQPFDTPEAMAAFARQNRIDDPRWRFLSPEPAQVARLLEELGFSYAQVASGIDHVTQATIVDAEGVVYRQVYGETFELPFFIGPLKELASGAAGRSLTLDNIWTKVKLYCTVYDPSSGRYRFDYSLFFELFAGITTLGAVAWVMVRGVRAGRAG